MKLKAASPNQKAIPITTVPARKKPEAKVEITQEVVEGYPLKIRQAREKLGLSHEDLAKKMTTGEQEQVRKSLVILIEKANRQEITPVDKSDF